PRVSVDDPPGGESAGRGSAQAALLGAVLPAPEPGLPDRRAALVHHTGQPEPVSRADHRARVPRAAAARDQAEIGTERCVAWRAGWHDAGLHARGRRRDDPDPTPAGGRDAAGTAAARAGGR